MIIVRIFVISTYLILLFESSDTVIAECSYVFGSWSEIGSIYYCRVQNNLNIESKDLAVVDQVNGTHQKKKADKNLIGFYVDNKNVQHFPRGLQKIFMNLKAIAIKNEKIKKLHQDDLKEYVKLEFLEFYKTCIEILEDDLFSYNPELKFVSFAGNKIFYIDEHVFDQLHKLNQLRLHSNKCISVEALKNADVKEVIEKLKTNCSSKNFSTIKHLEEAIAAINDQLNKKQESDDKKFAELEKSAESMKDDTEKHIHEMLADFKVEMKEVTGFTLTNYSILDASMNIMMNRIKKLEEGSDLWKLIIICITGFTQTIFLIIIYKKFFFETTSA